MPHYFIDTDDGDFHVLDDVGYDFPDAEAARLVAQRALTDMARQKLPDGEHRVFSSSVRTKQDGDIYRVTLSLSGSWVSERIPA